ncbi:hydantoinase B/oxoprolinase family protein [Longimicrobium terrae]|uniref:5-oxoprolinase (ATP-hydrolyzing) n=1 Tax=Longimicrobium terrae TaxID=1639882 RepID=A0A841H8D1_9BACT|nr:5-oxoprolinase (ATP-hydrolyzing) [Longimicrobium terrae]MBB6074086.1 5-oxoprolinase (ATP-hydrolyzing) [Longimicrobium terrae]NNC29444.1 5-oxoprolinase [Longimicrobium terrae]
MTERLWQIWIDTGGTFTDCLALDPAGVQRRAKVLSSSALRATIMAVEAPDCLRIREEWGAVPGVVDGLQVRRVGSVDEGARVASYDPATGEMRLNRALDGAAPGVSIEIRSAEEAPILAARLVTGTASGDALPPLAMRLATTRGTNALLERRGARTALFITRGFGDLSRIGTQQRPELFALDVRRPDPLYDTAVEVDERLAADGSVLIPLDLASVRAHASRLVGQGVRSAAVALMHAFRDPAHERAVADALREAGFAHVAASAELAASIGLLARTETAVVDAYLGPVIGGYLDGVRGALGGGRLHVMTSAGGLVRPEDFRAKDSLLSGPAGGVVGAALAGRRSGRERVIAFDMGGTSTDVARVDGDFEYVWEHEVAGARIVAPALAIESVAAGGGSICAVDAQGLRVGPESAGASPGPACYGAGGPLTVTDCNLLLGRLDPSRFAIPVDAEPARAAADRLAARVHEITGEAIGREALAAGLLEIADERMADAIRGISLRRGYDPAEYALVAFGGAGAQHGCGVAARLGMRTVIVPADAGLLSALGIGHAALERFAERQVLRPLDEAGGELESLFATLAAEATAAVAREGVPAEQIHVRRLIANLRYAGQDATLQIDVEAGADPRVAFEDRYTSIYGHRPATRPIEVESVRVIAATLPATVDAAEDAAEHPAAPVDHRRTWIGGGWTEVPVYERAALQPGAHLAGPALIAEQHSATYVAEGWSAGIDAAGNIVLRHEPANVANREAASASEEPHFRTLVPSHSRTSTPQSVRAELFISRFRALVGEMGEMLRRTALSTNVKERLDFSCALLDADGELVVNAPHIPVHLGAMGLCVRSVRDAIRMDAGDVIVTNHPGFGGSHLPDVTVITPVHDSDGTLIGYVASRAHHAEIGGTRPGSMPPAARTLAEEGVVIRPMHLVRGGEARWDDIRAVLSSGAHPTRALDDNLADLAAAVAANHRGAEMLRALAAEHGRDAVAGYMSALKQRAERGIRAALAALPDGVYEARERLDDGAPLQVRITIRGDEAEVDFTGSAATHPGNLNATPAIVRSVVLYVLRLLVRENLPLNEGLMRPVRLTVPAGLLNPPFGDDPSRDPAVVGGNTEVSQRLTDTLIRALRLSACSQGTMNNVLWGSDRFGYYETVCGGCGAGPTWDGAHATHSHMTNTRITDPEVVEHRYPVRVERFAIRAGSGGAGARRGGDGAVREFTFLAPMSLSVLTQHRTEGPFGMESGHPGAPGRQIVIRAGGESAELAPVDGVDVLPGDRLLLETPGGGGWGAPDQGA